MSSAKQIYRRENQLSPIERTGRPIWEALFAASVPYKFTLSKEQVRLFGMPTVGDQDIDRDIHNQPIYTYMTINQMVEYFRNGVSVSVTQHEDTKRIYDIIHDYLLAWKSNLERGINIGDTPIDDLVLLDRFASVVYQHAAQHFTQEFFSSEAIQQMTGHGTYHSRESLMREKEPPRSSRAVPVEQKNFPQHESMAELFSDRVMRGGVRVAGTRWDKP